MKISLKVTLAIMLAGTTLFTSCQSGNPGDTSGSGTDTTAAETRDSLSAEQAEQIGFKFSIAYANLPSPFNIVDDLYRYNAPYKKELLNPAGNASKYVKDFSREVNLGVYGIDLAYVNFYGKGQAETDLFRVVQDFSKELEIEEATNAYIQRYKDNSDNHDSLVLILDNAFYDVDSYLRKSERYRSAGNIMAGSVIEVCYLSMNLLKEIPRNEKNGVFFEKVYNENLGIYHVIKLLEEFTDQDSKKLLAGMKEYKSGYDSLIHSADDLTPENLEKAVVMIDKLRNSLVN
jgi:hypothetical protein